jgi:hypothetical protein
MQRAAACCGCWLASQERAQRVVGLVQDRLVCVNHCCVVLIRTDAIVN